MFSSCVGHRRLKNVTVRGYLSIFGQFFPFFGKMRILAKNGVWGSLYPLMPSNSMQNIKKSNEPILSNIQKSGFCPTAPPTFAPFWGHIGIFQKSDNIFNVLWYSIFMQKIIKNG